MSEFFSQGRAIAISAEQLNDASAGRDNDRMFLAAQEMLTIGALVSKMLIPPPGVTGVALGSF